MQIMSWGAILVSNIRRTFHIYIPKLIMVCVFTQNDDSSKPSLGHRAMASPAQRRNCLDCSTKKETCLPPPPLQHILLPCTKRQLLAQPIRKIPEFLGAFAVGREGREGWLLTITLSIYSMLSQTASPTLSQQSLKQV